MNVLNMWFYTNLRIFCKQIIHYTFIKNVFDYYSLITTFFSEPVLSNLLQKRKVSETELRRFEKKIRNIGEQQLKLTDGVILGGEQQ